MNYFLFESNCCGKVGSGYCNVIVTFQNLLKEEYESL